MDEASHQRQTGAAVPMLLRLVPIEQQDFELLALLPRPVEAPQRGALGWRWKPAPPAAERCNLPRGRRRSDAPSKPPAPELLP